MSTLTDNSRQVNVNHLPSSIAQDINNIKIHHNFDREFCFWLPNVNGSFDFKSDITKGATILKFTTISNLSCELLLLPSFIFAA